MKGKTQVANSPSKLASLKETRSKAEAVLFPPLVPYRLGLLIAIPVTFLSYALGMVSHQALFIAFASQLLFVTLAASYWHGRPNLTGWDLIVVSVVAGAGLRSYYFATNSPSREIIDSYFLRGQSAVDLVDDAALYSLAIALMGIGFWAGFRAQVDKSAKRTTNVSLNIDNPDFARVICRLVGLASLIALFIFAEVTGGVDLGNVSAKRAIRLHEISSTGFENILRTFSYIGIPAAVLHMGLRPASRRLAWWLWNALLFALATLPSVYTSSRQELFLIPILLMAVQRFCGRRTNLWVIAPLAVLTLGLFTFVSDARSTKYDSEAQVLPVKIDTLDSIAINRNMLDYTRLANLRMASELGRTQYKLGRTYIIPFIAPVPRSVWESKPIISPGIDFADEVYGLQEQGSIPPDGVTELHWNFGLAIMLALSPLLGGALGTIDGAAQTRITGNARWFLYILGPFLLSYRLITISFAHALTGTMQTALIAALVFALAGGKLKVKRNSARLAGPSAQSLT